MFTLRPNAKFYKLCKKKNDINYIKETMPCRYKHAFLTSITLWTGVNCIEALNYRKR